MTDPPEPSAPNPLPQVPDLELIRCIGQGGFGWVWLAVNRTTGALRAVKLIPLRGTAATDAAGREIVSLQHLEAHVGQQHPNVLAIHHVGKTAEHLFSIMDPADDLTGGPASRDPNYRPASLSSRLEGGPLPADDCHRFARQLLGGLAHLHAAGMVHRDVKPANCLLVGGVLKLADFGLLTAADPLVSRVGTLAYMPPDGRMGAAADVYAAGLVIYEMLTGFPAESFPQLGERAAEIAADPRLRRLNRLVLRACQPDPRRRFPDARTMLAELEAAEANGTTPPARHRHRVAFVLAAAMIAATVLAAVGFWPRAPQRVDVNFITEPFEATIELDGQRLLQPDGTPYTTPCTVPDLRAGTHRVVFHKDGLADLNAGQLDLATTREVIARW